MIQSSKKLAVEIIYQQLVFIGFIMINKKYLAIITFFTLLGLFYLGSETLFDYKEEQKVERVTRQVSTDNHNTNNDIDKPVHKSETKIKQELKFISPTSEALETAKQGVNDYIGFNQYADRAERKTALFQNWDLNPDILELQHDILVKKDIADSLFGENQAHARLLAIDYLGYLSSNGQRKPIEKTISALSQRINNEEWSKGIEHDYVDLILKYTDSLSQDELMSNFEVIVEFSGYSQKSHDLFTTGLSLSETVLLLPDSKMEELKTRLNLVKEQL
ncbi:hypothetical protein [Pseudoalteromonas piscicida]|uniref:Uncharacterized protein n=1 Tax=Pseudoalteromonas piscicida TaxID=43662 RepID=A0AAD0W543_PSEO7|nr:hypothetical protein [Pseudoalteromonas piscicida]ASD66065.1 hypothetical protein B1L02_02775 [Pseudoalteromonas piscicida]AXR03232.1 hypothetical protein D0511_14985 [Pseudoalteromonas piscicida]